MKINEDILKGKWTQFRGTMRETWGKLTDDDLDQIAGRWEQLVGTIQEKYGYTREEAEEQVENFMEKIETRFSS
ncbi:MAG TPA: CsbD family protein [Anaerolineales bacterium]|nr:CsbD family protein [Anaerolineales bacterium]